MDKVTETVRSSDAIPQTSVQDMSLDVKALDTTSVFNFKNKKLFCALGACISILIAVGIGVSLYFAVNRTFVKGK